MIWLKHIDKGVFIFGIFQFFVFELVLFKVRQQLLPLVHGQDLSTFYNFIAVVFEIPGADPRPLM